jgi:hypothetical protein
MVHDTTMHPFSNPILIPDIQEINRMDQLREQAIQSLEISDGFVKCQRCKKAVRIVGGLTRSCGNDTRIDFLRKRINNVRDDEYYLSNHDKGILLDDIPPRFYYYKHIRAKLGLEHGITQDELNYALKRYLRMSPEQRYQREKSHYYFHELYIEGGRGMQSGAWWLYSKMSLL